MYYQHNITELCCLKLKTRGPKFQLIEIKLLYSILWVRVRVRDTAGLQPSFNAEVMSLTFPQCNPVPR